MSVAPIVKSAAAIIAPYDPTADGPLITDGYETTATAAGTTTLTAANANQQYFTGTTTQTVKLPVVSTLVLGFTFRVVNHSTGVVTVQSSGANTIQALAADTYAIFTCILLTGTTAASWDVQYFAPGSGVGDVVGPASAVDSNFAMFDGVTGKLLKDSGLSLDTDGTLAADSDTRVPSQKAVKTFVSSAVSGLLDLKGSTDCSADPDYPAALKGDTYYVTIAGRIGGASGKAVDVGDTYIALNDNAGGSEASVGTDWFVLEHNLPVGILLASNNLSDLANAATARTNLGLGSLATQNGTFSGTSSGTNTGDQTISLTGDVTGSGTGSFAATIANGAVTEAKQTLADNTTNNVSTAKHGYAPKAPNDATKYLDGTGAYSVPAGSGSVTSVSNTDGSLTVATGTTTPVVSLDSTKLGYMGGAWNLGFTYSASAGAGTLTLTDAAGGTLSASALGALMFGNGTGLMTTTTAVAAVTLTLTSGATLGGSANYFRAWVVLFNDAGTLRLGVINCRDGTNIYPLAESIAVSSTAMSSSSDSAGVFYTDSAVTSKYFRVLGYLEFDSWTAGTWVTATRISAYSPGCALPGDLMQVRRQTSANYSTTTATIPRDDTIPQNGEGGQFFDQAIVPSSKANVLIVSTYIWVSNSDLNAVIFAFFQDSTANAIFAGDLVIPAAAYRLLINAEYRLMAGTTSTTTFYLRLGGGSAGTTSINGPAGIGRYYGGASTSWFQVQEIMA